MSGINPKIWGETFWRFIHLVTTKVHDIPHLHDDAVYLLFILGFLIPCRHCRVFYKNAFNLHPPTKTKHLFAWGCDLHNKVNMKLRKEIISCDVAWRKMNIFVQESFGLSCFNLLIVVLVHFPNNPDPDKLVNLNKFLNIIGALSKKIEPENPIEIQTINTKQSTCNKCLRSIIFKTFENFHRIEDFDDFNRNLNFFP